MFAPIFEKNSDRFILRLEDYIAEDHNGAWEIGWGIALVEGVIMGFKFTSETIEIEGEVPHVPANLGGWPVAVLSGPTFDCNDNAIK